MFLKNPHSPSSGSALIPKRFLEFLLRHYSSPSSPSWLTENSRSALLQEILIPSGDQHSKSLIITTQINGKTQEWQGTFHRSQKWLIIELEEDLKIDDFSMNLNFLYKLKGSPNQKEFFNSIVSFITKLTHFERVMVYQLHENKSGEVIAETKEQNLISFLGLHFPASDIPEQARILYQKNTLRIIPDTNYTACPLLTKKDSDLENSLDLSQASLRSISPIHCEYLKNMGVKASMSISILDDHDELWGLIACHHYQNSKFVSFKIRTECEFFGQMISWQLSNIIKIESNESRIKIKTQLAGIFSKISTSENFPYSLIQIENSLLKLTQSDGLIITTGEEIYLSGYTTSIDQIKSLINWLRNTLAEKVSFTTRSLAEHFPPEKAFTKEASGVLAISISKTHQDLLIWLRPEIIPWGGNPNQAIGSSPSGLRLSPRKSFELWKESLGKPLFQNFS